MKTKTMKSFTGRFALLLSAALTAAWLSGCSATAPERTARKNGTDLLKKGKYEEAIEVFTETIDADVSNTDAYFGRAQAYLALGGDDNVSLAIDDLTKVTETDNRAMNAYSTIIGAYISSGDFEKALEILDEAEAKLCRGKRVILYSPDGQLEVALNRARAYLGMGWAFVRTTVLYSADGMTLTVPEEKVEEYKADGWYTEPVTTLYAPDGRTQVVPESEVEEYTAVGWYTEPVTTLYAPDGRTQVAPESEVEEYTAVGWYTEPVTTLYAPDGRTQVVPESKASEYTAVGWYTEPVTTLYAPDGRTLVVAVSEVEAYTAVGWFTEPV